MATTSPLRSMPVMKAASPTAAMQVAVARAFGDRVFAHVDLVLAAVVRVVLAGRCSMKNSGDVVVVLVQQFDGAVLGHAVPELADQLHLGISLLDGVVEEGVTLVVERAAVLVADLHELQVERRGVAGLGPQRAPFALRRAVGVLDGIQGVLHVLVHLVHRHVVVVGHAAVDDEQRLGPDVLAELEIFVVAQAVVGMIAPEIIVAGRSATSPIVFFQRKASASTSPST